jgi:hydrogenase maturation protease
MSTNGIEGTTLVLGVGNPLLGDEGFGVHVARRLKEVELPSHVKVLEGGIGGFNLLGFLEEVERLLVVDVMMLDAAPGELRLLKPGPELQEPGKEIISFHQIGVLELVQMWGLLGYEPEMLFLVTRPEKIEWSTELSPPLQAAVERAIELIPVLCRESFEKESEGLCLP